MTEYESFELSTSRRCLTIKIRRINLNAFFVVAAGQIARLHQNLKHLENPEITLKLFRSPAAKPQEGISRTLLNRNSSEVS